MISGLVVSNSSILIHLSRINRLKLLKEIFGRIVIPKAVYEECVVEGKPGADEIGSSNWIEVREVKDVHLKRVLQMFLDEGEAEAIVLAIESNADLILLDEAEARKIAKSLGLRVTGTIGILLKAKKLGLIKRLKEEIDALRKTGFWISEKLIYKILQEAGESH